jgi:hypothetical protein
MPAGKRVEPHEATIDVIALEGGQYWKRDTSACQSRVIIEFLRDALTFFLNIPTYSEEDLITAITTFRNGEYTSIRACAYAFNIPRLTPYFSALDSNFTFYFARITEDTLDSRRKDSLKVCLSTLEVRLPYYPSFNERSR